MSRSASTSRRQRFASALVSKIWVPQQVRQSFEQAASLHPELRSALAANPHLSQDSWSVLFASKKLSNDDAHALVSRRLTDEQLVVVFRRERRVTVLLASLHHNNLPSALVDEVLADANTPAKFLEALLERDTLSSAQRLAAGRRVGGVALLEALVTTDLATGAPIGSLGEVITALSALAEDAEVNAEGARGKRELSFVLQLAFEGFPALADLASLHPASAVRAAAAGSRHLGSAAADDLLAKELPLLAHSHRAAYTLMALCANPVVAPELVVKVSQHVADLKAPGYELYSAFASLRSVCASRANRFNRQLTDSYAAVEDSELLRFLLRRSMPNESRPLGRPFDQMALRTNPALSSEEAQMLQERLFLLQHSSPLLRRALAAFAHSNGDRPWAGALLESVLPSPLERFPEPTPVDPTRLNELTLEFFADQLTLPGGGVGDYLASQLGTDPKRWETFFSLLDSIPGTRSVADLATMAATV